MFDFLMLYEAGGLMHDDGEGPDDELWEISMSMGCFISDLKLVVRLAVGGDVASACSYSTNLRLW